MVVVRKNTADGYRAHVHIDGQSATLDRIFVGVGSGGVTPRVLFVDLFGTARNGKRVSERLVP